MKKLRNKKKISSTSEKKLIYKGFLFLQKRRNLTIIKIIYLFYEKKMKVLKAIIVIMIIGFTIHWNSSYALDQVFGDQSIVNKDNTKVISDHLIEDPTTTNYIRKGTQGIIRNESDTSWIEGIITANQSGEIKNHEEARDKTIERISRIVNYALGLLGVIALVFLLIQGFKVLIWWETSKAMTGIKNAAIALCGIGLSWLIISFILRVIENVTK